MQSPQLFAKVVPQNQGFGSNYAGIKIINSLIFLFKLKNLFL